MDLFCCCRTLIECWWVLQAKIFVQLKVGESHQCNVEFHESANNFVVNIKWKPLVELVWSDPSNLLSHQLDLKVYALDAEECLFEGLCNGAVVHPLPIKPLSHLNIGVFDAQALMLREISEQRNQAKSVIHVFQQLAIGVDLFDHGAQIRVFLGQLGKIRPVRASRHRRLQKLETLGDLGKAVHGDHTAGCR